MVFDGEFDAEVYEDYGHWLPYIDMFLMLCDGETGSFMHWPFDGAYMDQPAGLMQILREVQTQYRIHLRDMMRRSR